MRTQSHRRRSAICVTSVLSCFQFLSQVALHFSSLPYTCNLTRTHSKWLQISCRGENVLHGSGARFLSTMEAQVGWLQVQLVQTQHELQCAFEQIRILTLQVNSNASTAAAAAKTTASATTTAGSQSQMPKVNHQFGKDLIPNIFDGKQTNDFREWAANSALYLSAQCVDACEILLEWLVSDKEHVVTDTEIQTRCHAEDWENDNINTFSRVTLCLRINEGHHNSKEEVTSGKRGDRLDVWRQLFQEYEPQLVSGAQALLRRALSMPILSPMFLTESKSWKSW